MSEQQVSWGDPSPAASYAVGVGTTAIWAFLTGRVGIQDLHIFSIWLVAVGLIITLAGLISLRRGDSVGGCLNIVFGALFFCAPAITNLVFLWGGKPMAALGVTETPGLSLNGWIFMLLGIILCPYIPIMARQSWLSMVAILAFVVAIFLFALFTLQRPEAQATALWYAVKQIAGWLIGVAGLVMVYVGIATALSQGLGRSVLPIPRPLVAGAAPGTECKQKGEVG